MNLDDMDIGWSDAFEKIKEFLTHWNVSIETSSAPLSSEAPFDPNVVSFNASHQQQDRTPVIVAGAFELLVCLIGVPANLLVLYLWFVIFKDQTQHESMMASNNHWFILGITSADLVFAGLHSPLVAAWFLGEYELGSIGCLFLVAVTHAATTASSINVLLLNIDKFLYLHKPLRYYDLVTRKHAVGALIGGWTVAIGWSLFFTFGPLTRFDGERSCSSMEITRPLEYVCFSIVFFILPIAVSFAISCYIATITARASRQPYEIGSPDCDSQKHHRGRWKRLAFIFTTTAWSTATCLPYRFAYILHRANYVTYTRYLWLYYTFYVMMAMTAAGNPFITVFTQPHYRKRLIRLIKRGSGSRGSRKRSGASHNSTYVGMVLASPEGAGCVGGGCGENGVMTYVVE